MKSSNEITPEENKINPYSDKKTKQNRTDENSVLKPLTNSLSPSGKSKGLRWPSTKNKNKRIIIHTTNNNKQINFHTSLSTRYDNAVINKENHTKEIIISNLKNWILPRTLPRREKEEEDPHPDIIIKRPDKDQSLKKPPKIMFICSVKLINGKNLQNLKNIITFNDGKKMK